MNRLTNLVNHRLFETKQDKQKNIKKKKKKKNREIRNFFEMIIFTKFLTIPVYILVQRDFYT